MTMFIPTGTWFFALRFYGKARIHIHMLVLVPVKAGNNTDITSTSEPTKTRAMITPSNSLKLRFTDVVDCSLGPLEQRQCRYEREEKLWNWV
jgi:hypothetical protein